MADTESEQPEIEETRSGNQPAPVGGTISLTVFLMFSAIVLLGFLSLTVSGPHTGFFQTIYRGIGLLDHDSGWAFEENTGTKSRVFRVLAVVAPLFTAATVIYIITDRLRPALIRLRASWLLMFTSSRGVALIGLTESSLALANALRVRSDGTGRRYIPVIFTDDRSSGLLARCQRLGIATCPRHEHSPWRGLWAAWADRRTEGTPGLNRFTRRTQDLISFLPSAAAQMDFLVELQGWQPWGKPRRAWVLLDDRGLSQRLDQLGRWSGQAVIPRLLTLEMLAARQLLISHQFDVLADAFRQEQIHLVIYGLGKTGRAIVKEAAQLYVTRPCLGQNGQAPRPLRITAFDQHGAVAKDALLAEDPGIVKVVHLAVHKMAIPSAGLLETQVNDLPPDVTGHVIAFGDPSRCLNLAISLRRWLLQPPSGTGAACWSVSHAAPIFVRIANRRGVGRLFETHKARRTKASAAMKTALNDPPPDGLFDFGAIEVLFGSPDQKLWRLGTVLDEQGERGAQAVHEAYRSTVGRGSFASPKEAKRTADTAWCKLPPQLRESNFRAYDHIAVKARAAGCRFVPGDNGSPADLSALHAHAAELSKLEHLRYNAERLANGWRPAANRLDAVGVHPDLVAWGELDADEKALDQAQIKALPQIAHAAGHRLATALIIGVTGHCPKRIAKTDQHSVRDRMRAQLRSLVHDNKESLPLLLTALAPGTDSWAAELALELHIPFLAILPLPYEIMREDFPDKADLAAFHHLAAAAEQQIELPMVFGLASEMTRNPQPAAAGNLAKRAKQYALASAYIVERAHEMIAVWDGRSSEDAGGPADVLKWWTDGLPSAYQSPINFFPRPMRRSGAIIIDPGKRSVRRGAAPACGTHQ